MGKLWYKKPASVWEEALPVGNGRMGAMIYGGVEGELIQVNEESMWFGGPVDRLNEDAGKNLPRIRELLEKGEIHKAEQLMDVALSGCPNSMHSYQTLGEIQIRFDLGEAAENRMNWYVNPSCMPKEVKEYERELDLDKAITRVQFLHEETVYQRECFASHPADGILIHFTADTQKKLNFTTRLSRGRWYDGVQKLGQDGILLYGNLGRGGYEFAMALFVVASTGQTETIGEALEVSNADDVLLYFTADTTYQHPAEEINQWLEAEAKKEAVPDRMAELEDYPIYQKQEISLQKQVQRFLKHKLLERFEAVRKQSYEQLKEEHLKDYAVLFNRFELTLDTKQKEEKKPTDQRLLEVQNGYTDIGLQKLLFDFGRYLTIAGSRKEGLPTTLQGLWNQDFFPAWDSKYTININTEMNYWHVEDCNLSECHLPLFTLLKKIQKNGRITARKMYGCRGFVAHHNTDIHGDTAPQDIWYPGSYWVMGGAWLSTHLWKHYLYTRDQAFLKEAFPIMTEAALFFVDFLIEKDGYLVTSPSVSPENTYRLPSGETGSCCIGCTMDNQILRDLFDDCIEAYQEFDAEGKKELLVEGIEELPALMKQIEDCRNRLRPTQISADGRIMEWMEDYEEVEPGHRHISHLYGLYPAGQITVDGTPELARAASKTLEYRLSHGGGHTGWSRAWIMNHYASLWDGKRTFEHINKMLEQSTYPNLFDKHPPFQIDGNFGACAAMARMIIQSNRERIVLLPALPKEWENGAVRGFRVVGNAEIEMKWENGEIIAGSLKAYSDLKTEINYHGEHFPIELLANESVDLIEVLNELETPNLS